MKEVKENQRDIVAFDYLLEVGKREVSGFAIVPCL